MMQLTETACDSVFPALPDLKSRCVYVYVCFCTNTANNSFFPLRNIIKQLLVIVLVHSLLGDIFMSHGAILSTIIILPCVTYKFNFPY